MWKDKSTKNYLIRTEVIKIGANIKLHKITMSSPYAKHKAILQEFRYPRND